MDRAQIASAAWYRGSANSEGITGSNDDDTFDGKGGNDTLTGYVGNDAYIYGVGSGNDIILEAGVDAGTDNVKLVGLNASDVEFMRWNNNLYITINATGERIQVDNQFSGGAGIEQVTFANGDTMDRAQIASAAWFRGTSGNDNISGERRATIRSLAGPATIPWPEERATTPSFSAPTSATIPLRISPSAATCSNFKTASSPMRQRCSRRPRPRAATR